jgi:hypothetical protein
MCENELPPNTCSLDFTIDSTWNHPIDPPPLNPTLHNVWMCFEDITFPYIPNVCRWSFHHNTCWRDVKEWRVFKACACQAIHKIPTSNTIKPSKCIHVHYLFNWSASSFKVFFCSEGHILFLAKYVINMF